MKSGSPDETIFVHIPRLLNFVCSKCGEGYGDLTRQAGTISRPAGRLVGAKKNPARFPAGEALDMDGPKNAAAASEFG